MIRNLLCLVYLAVSPRTSNWNAVIAFNSLALIFLVGALVINILLFVGFTEKYQMFMIIITVFVGIGCKSTKTTQASAVCFCLIYHGCKQH